MVYKISDDYQTMSFNVSNYQGCESEMWRDIMAFQQILLKNRREFIMSFDGCTYIINYNYERDLDYGNAVPVWVEEDWDVDGNGEVVED